MSALLRCLRRLSDSLGSTAKILIASVGVLMTACHSGYEITIRNEDSVLLTVSVGTNRNTRQKDVVLRAGATETVRIEVEGESVLDTVVMFRGSVVLHEENGYVDPVSPNLDTHLCVSVWRERLRVLSC